MDKRWLWVVRVTALLPILPVLVFAFWAYVPGLRSRCADEIRPLAAFLVFMILPFLIMSGQLWRKSLKKGLALALVTGAIWSAFGLIIVVAVGSDEGLFAGLGASLMLVIPGTLTLSAIKTYYSMPREEGDRNIFITRIVLMAVYFGFLVMGEAALPSLLRSRQVSSEASAVGALRTIHTAEVTYQETYRQAYSPTLAALGPPALTTASSGSAASLIDEVLASGKKSGYTFTYTPGLPDAKGRVMSYTVTARPSDPECKGWRNFFTDESGVIRVTREDRHATAQDPLLPG